MARIISKKFPKDQSRRNSIGFGFPLNGGAVFIPTYQTRDQIKANLINYLLTNKGERIFNPTFGADLRSLLFENIVETSLEVLKNTIQNKINNYFPEVEINLISFKPEPDKNEINFTLDYSITAFGVEDTLNILLQ